jgi:hypothetical protein
MIVAVETSFFISVAGLFPNRAELWIITAVGENCRTATAKFCVAIPVVQLDASSTAFSLTEAFVVRRDIGARTE